MTEGTTTEQALVELRHHTPGTATDVDAGALPGHRSTGP
jgi:hypothetical protein